MVAGKSSTVISGSKNSRYRATKPAPAFVTAMNRHSSNNVKMLKIAASAMKQMTKLTTSERSNVASIRFGKPNPEKRRCDVGRGFVAMPGSFDLEIETDEMSGIRFINRKNKLRA